MRKYVFRKLRLGFYLMYLARNFPLLQGLILILGLVFFKGELFVIAVGLVLSVFCGGKVFRRVSLALLMGAVSMLVVGAVREDAIEKEDSAIFITQDLGLLATIENDYFANLTPTARKLAAGMLWGEKSLSAEEKGWFRTLGISHVLVVSGANFSLFVGLIAGLTGLFPRKVLALISGVVITGYLLIVGLDNLPAVRAYIMSMLGLVFIINKRLVLAFPALMAAVAAILLLSPETAEDIGFQLSAISTAVVIALSGKFSFSIWRGYLLEIRLLLGLMLATMPVVWVNFQQVSVWGLVTNLVLVPYLSLWSLASLVIAALSYLLIGPLTDLFIGVLGFHAGIIFELARTLSGLNLGVITDSLVLTLFLFFAAVTYLAIDYYTNA